LRANCGVPRYRDAGSLVTRSGVKAPRTIGRVGAAVGQVGVDSGQPGQIELPEAQALGGQLRTPALQEDGRSIELPGPCGGEACLLPEPLGCAEPDLLLGAAELVPPEAVRRLEGEGLRDARLGPARPADCPVAPVECRVERDLEIVRERIPAGLPDLPGCLSAGAALGVPRSGRQPGEERHADRPDGAGLSVPARDLAAQLPD
jgi:hypothetical protein